MPEERDERSYVFLDPVSRHPEAWRAVYKGRLLALTWNSKGAAQEELSLLEQGYREPEYWRP